jgi:hypothetical protein
MRSPGADALAKQIVALPCQTLAGLTMKALLIQHSWPTAFEPAVGDVDGMDERPRYLVPACQAARSLAA